MKVVFEHPALEEFAVENNEFGIVGIPFKKSGYGYIDYKYQMMVEGKMEVCPSCGGTGTHERRDIDCSEIVEMYLEDGDYDGVERYFNGAYDVICTQCKGKNVVAVPVWESIPKVIADEIQSWDESAEESAAIQCAERAMGA